MVVRRRWAACAHFWEHPTGCKVHLGCSLYHVMLLHAFHAFICLVCLWCWAWVCEGGAACADFCGRPAIRTIYLSFLLVYVACCCMHDISESSYVVLNTQQFSLQDPYIPASFTEFMRFAHCMTPSARTCPDALFVQVHYIHCRGVVHLFWSRGESRRTTLIAMCMINLYKECIRVRCMNLQSRSCFSRCLKVASGPTRSCSLNLLQRFVSSMSDHFAVLVLISSTAPSWPVFTCLLERSSNPAHNKWSLTASCKIVHSNFFRWALQLQCPGLGFRSRQRPTPLT